MLFFIVSFYSVITNEIIEYSTIKPVFIVTGLWLWAGSKEMRLYLQSLPPAAKFCSTKITDWGKYQNRD